VNGEGQAESERNHTGQSKHKESSLRWISFNESTSSNDSLSRSYSLSWCETPSKLKLLRSHSDIQYIVLLIVEFEII